MSYGTFDCCGSRTCQLQAIFGVPYKVVLTTFRGFISKVAQAQETLKVVLSTKISLFVNF